MVNSKKIQYKINYNNETLMEKTLPTQKGGYTPYMVEQQYRATFERSIINNVNTAVRTITAMRLRQYAQVTIPVYNQLRFETVYIPSLNKTVYVSPLFCSSDWYFDIVYKSYIVTSGGVPVTGEIRYIDIELIQKSFNCPMSPLSINSPTILLSSNQSPLSDPDEQAREERRRQKKLRKKLDDLEEDLEDKDSELEEKTKQIDSIKDELTEIKKELEKRKKKKPAAKKKKPAAKKKKSAPKKKKSAPKKKKTTAKKKGSKK
ncbi:hypothetical protein CPAV1605_1510 [seawater metagenome]|uniref:Uncharacterized protein n=1 Tax=seawater metagenome TaxID=1561972 RepID=A0A5E8CLE4_9ZZZZ